MKMYNYVILAIGLTLLFEFAGILTSGGILPLMGLSFTSNTIVFDYDAGDVIAGRYQPRACSCEAGGGSSPCYGI